ncbi:MAG: ribonuclease HII [Chryseobacterium sp.]|nr:MAG: ribonuclease HII [Chryseobacterium sp.]
MKLKNRFSSGNKYIEAGCDEVGRGCLAGPVVAAAVITGRGFKHELIKDSKLLTKKQIAEMDSYIREKAIDFAVAEACVETIDRHNILKASVSAMHKALEQLNQQPELILVDGNYFLPYNFIPHQCIIKGDSKILSIAAASILAKKYRDDLMLRLHNEFPQYGWDTNVGYATKKHRDAIREHGYTVHHRKSFTLKSLLSEETKRD